MSIARPAILVFLGFGLLTPFVHFQGLYEVDVKVSFREASPTTHTVSLQGVSLTVPPGRSARQSLRLKGGGRRALAYTVQGWGFSGRPIEVDGKEIPRQRIRRTCEAGTIRILGFGRSPAMDLEIELGGLAASRPSSSE